MEITISGATHTKERGGNIAAPSSVKTLSPYALSTFSAAFLRASRWPLNAPMMSLRGAFTVAMSPSKRIVQCSVSWLTHRQNTPRIA